SGSQRLRGRQELAPGCCRQIQQSARGVDRPEEERDDLGRLVLDVDEAVTEHSRALWRPTYHTQRLGEQRGRNRRNAFLKEPRLQRFQVRGRLPEAQDGRRGTVERVEQGLALLATEACEEALDQESGEGVLLGKEERRVGGLFGEERLRVEATLQEPAGAPQDAVRERGRPAAASRPKQRHCF